jgi:hypothetical protein
MNTRSGAARRAIAAFGSSAQILSNSALLQPCATACVPLRFAAQILHLPPNDRHPADSPHLPSLGRATPLLQLARLVVAARHGLRPGQRGHGHAVIQDLLGHASIANAVRYTKLAPRRLAAVRVR